MEQCLIFGKIEKGVLIILEFNHKIEATCKLTDPLTSQQASFLQNVMSTANSKLESLSNKVTTLIVFISPRPIKILIIYSYFLHVN